MAFRRTVYEREADRPEYAERSVADAPESAPVYEPVYDERRTWSPAQIVGLIIGIGFTVLGIAAIVRTGFDTAHIYTPHVVVWHLPHSPLFAAIEIAFGVLVILASVVPGGARTPMALLGAIALAFGIVVLVDAGNGNLNHWLAATRRTGWLFVVTGAVLVLAALFSPVFALGSRRDRAVPVR